MVNLDGALALVGFIKSELAMKHRKEMRKILRRYLAGDASLVGEIKANASSTNVVNQMAQESLAGTVRRQVEEDPDTVSLDVYERRVKIKHMEAEVRQMDANTMLIQSQSVQIQAESMQIQAESMTKLCNLYMQLCPNGIMDDRAKLMLKDCVLNVAMSQQGGLQVGGGSASQLAITTGPSSSSVAAPASQEEAKPLTLSTFAVELGIRANNSQLQKAGIILARLYAQRYNGAKPSKHDQFVDGAVRSVNSYYRKDKDLVEQALREAIAK